MGTVDELESVFKSKASFCDTSELLFTREVAFEIIEPCAKKGILILGLDFYVCDGQDYGIGVLLTSRLKAEPDAVPRPLSASAYCRGLPDKADFVSFVLDEALNLDTYICLYGTPARPRRRMWKSIKGA
jgi:hypothetical protein